ncbi:CD8A protein, partial [Atlantisia rogersi]|nr:CD8A protein [Atlantisia rogersi]
IKQPQLGQRLELECRTDKDDSGMFWVRLDRGGTLHFIVFISSLSRTIFSEGIGTRFEAKRDGSSYWLVAKNLTAQDEGKYFCIMNSNQMLYFSPGYPVYFPAKTTVPPTTAAPTTQNGTKFLTSNTPNPVTSKKEELNFICNHIIWIPLAGSCILLLLALIVTIILCQKTRRRRCRCKR